MLSAGVVAALGVLPASHTCAQTATSAPATVQSAPVQPDYHPSLGDLMTLAVQPRHIKLGLAGQERNWPYAQYELSELRNAFARVGRTIPVYRSTDMAALINAMTAEPLDAVEHAIRATDGVQFTAAYAHLTQVCNACHVSQDHAMIVIRIPQGTPYPDQDFRFPKR
jgi:hypothetical protein